MVKRYEELTISDDFMFGKTMGDKVLCQDVLEQLLEEKVGELEDVQPQREFRYTSGGKPIRLDIYTRDKSACTMRRCRIRTISRWRSWNCRNGADFTSLRWTRII